MAKRELTNQELKDISPNLLQKYNKMGYVPYIDDDDPEKEILWGTESQVVFNQVDRSQPENVYIPRLHFWAWIHMLYANFLWVILFVLLVIFTILLMMYDFDIKQLYHAFKDLFYDYL